MIVFTKAGKNYINDIAEIEKECFSTPWPKSSFEKDICKNKFAVYIVAVDDETGKVVGYGGMWHVVNEGHITNIAVSEKYRRQGIGAGIIDAFEKICEENEMIGMTLEVRRGNQEAMGLYRKKGFRISGIRPEYYNDTKEDAIIMWKYFISEECIDNSF